MEKGTPYLLCPAYAQVCPCEKRRGRRTVLPRRDTGEHAMSGGGLPAIDPWEIERHWLEHELLRLQTMERVHGRDFSKEINSHKEALRDNKAHTKKPMAKVR